MILRASLAYGLLLTLLPLFLFSFFPSQDGPAHVNSLATLTALGHHDPFLSEYFYRQATTITNFVDRGVFSILESAVGLDRLEPAFVAFYLLTMLAALLLTFRYLLKISGYWIVLFLPFLYPAMLHKGSYNLCLSSVLLVPLLGFLYRYSIDLSVRAAAGVAVVLVVTFLIHPQMALFGLAGVAVFAAWMVFIDRVGKNRFRSWLDRGDASPGASWRQAVVLCAATVPTLVCCFVFIAGSQKMESAVNVHYAGIVKKAVSLVFLEGVSSYSLFGLAVSTLLILGVCWLLVALARRIAAQRPLRVSAIDPCLLFAAALLVFYVVTPEGLGEVSNVEERVSMPLMLSLLTWIGVRGEGVLELQHVAIFAAVILTFQTVDRVAAFRFLQERRAEYAEAVNRIPPRIPIFSVTAEDIWNCRDRVDARSLFRVHLRFSPFKHLLGEFVASREVAFIGNYEAWDKRPYFPLKFQPAVADYIGRSDFGEMTSRETELKTFSAFVAKLRANNPFSIAYMVVWSEDPSCLETAEGKDIKDVIASNFSPVFTSSHGRVSLYKITSSGPADGVARDSRR